MANNTTSSKDRLIQAARSMLIETGEAGASVKAIALRAGVNHGLVHHYFGSKEQLWVAVVEAEERVIHEALVGSSGMAPNTFLQNFFRPELLENRERLHLILELVSLSRKYVEVAHAVRGVLRQRRETLGRIFGIEDEATTLALMGTTLGLVVQSTLEPTLPLSAALETMIAMIQKEQSTP